MERRLRVPLSVAGLLALTGCSLIGSSSALSDSLSDSASVGSRSVAGSARGVSASSESSSPAEDGAHAWLEDVRVVTAAVAAGGPLDAGFLRQLGAVARHHGVSDWEGRDATFRAVGEGLREAGVAPEALEAWTSALPRLDARRRALVREGYASASP